MQITEITIGTNSVATAMADFARFATALEQGERLSMDEEAYFTELQTFCMRITDERLSLLRAIKAHHLTSVDELARIVSRDEKSVLADLKILEHARLVEIKETRTLEAEVKRPVLSKPEFGRITVTIEPELYEWFEDFCRERKRARKPWKRVEVVREALLLLRSAQSRG